MLDASFNVQQAVLLSAFIIPPAFSLCSAASLLSHTTRPAQHLLGLHRVGAATAVANK